MLQLGSSKHWTYAMEVLTQGEEHTFNQSALIDYFEPLIEYLTLDNQRTGEVIGWEEIIQASGNSFSKKFLKHLCFACKKMLFSCFIFL